LVDLDWATLHTYETALVDINDEREE